MLLIVVWLAVLGWNYLFRIGVYGGDKAEHYKPSQPINFNHTLHAGADNLAISCQYCHSSAEKSKNAGIPSANVCMNCHQAVSEGPTTGTEEIAKIYEATGWDPTTMTYTGHEKPIVWNKVHNLPDHVYFSHEQHVAVGKIECQKCHGPVDTEMDQVQQWSPLTMAWSVATTHQNRGRFQTGTIKIRPLAAPRWAARAENIWRTRRSPFVNLAAGSAPSAITKTVGEHRCEQAILAGFVRDGPAGLPANVGAEVQ